MRAAPLRVDSRIDPGVQLGPYRVEHRLAHARASTLYSAHDSEGQRVLVRVVQPEAATAAARARLKREARVLAGIDHPGVVRLHGLGEHEGMLWIAWAYVRGTDLERLLAERGPLPCEVALSHAIQVAQALTVVHEAGIVHRDLKPSNVLLSSTGQVVLVDFGIAPRGTEARDSEEATGVRESLEEASAYAAPEQLEHGLADERSDVWALGCLLYEMIVGEPPFGHGGAATAASIPRDEPIFPASMPPPIAHIITACLRKNSFARIARAREIIALLRDVLDDPPSESNPPSERSDRPSAYPSVRPAFPVSGTIPRPPRVPSVSLGLPPARTSASSAGRPPASATRARTARGRIKGTALRAGIAWFAEHFGPAGMSRVMDLASPELKGMLRSKNQVFGLIASGWYDTQLVGELVELLECVAAPSDRAAFSTSVGEAIAQDNVTGVHRALFRLVASPPLLEANAQRVWRTYVDEGTLSVRLRGPGSFEAFARGWSRHHPSVCRTLQAMLQSSLRTVGYPALVLERTHCIGAGDTQCAFDGVWVIA